MVMTFSQLLSPPYALGDIGFFNDPSHGTVWLIEKACPWPPSVLYCFFYFDCNVSATFLGGDYYFLDAEKETCGDWHSVAFHKNFLDG